MNSSSVKKLIVKIVILCMVLPMVFPVFGYAQTQDGIISVDGNEIPLTVAPSRTELGLMASAEDIANAFSLEYTFDPVNNAFEMYDEEHGKIVLMHNATVFCSGDSFYECAPYFYIRDGVPTVEVGFFCNMFASSYTYNEEENTITIDTTKISDSVAKINVNGTIKPLYMEPVPTRYGINVRLADLTENFGILFEFDEFTGTAVLTDCKGEQIELYDGAGFFKTSRGEIVCSTLFNVVEDIPMIDAGFFCDLYGASYDYDKDTKTLTLYEGIIMEQKLAEDQMELFGAYDSYVYGGFNYPEGAPEGGLSVKIILQQTDERYVMYQGYSYVAGDKYVIGQVDLEEGETKGYFEYCVGDYYEYNYDTYSLYFETSDENYGYISKNGTTLPLSYSPMDYKGYNYSAEQFSFYSDSYVDFLVGSPHISGSVKLPSGMVAPQGGIDVELILQTRTSTYSGIYFLDSYYYVYDNNSLGTITIDEGEDVAYYDFDVSDYYIDGYDYCYYSLYYYLPDYDTEYPYGYYNIYNGVSPSYVISWPGDCAYIYDAKSFDFMSSHNADMTLALGQTPTTDAYISIKVGEDRAVIGGEYVYLDSPPISVDGYVFVPIRFIAEALGFSVEWNSSTKTVTFYGDENVLSMKVGDGNCTIINDRTYVCALKFFETMLSGDLYIEYSSDSIMVYVGEEEPEEPDVIYGDANGDGEVDFADAIVVLKYDAGLTNLDDDALYACDVNYDDEVDFVDAILILKYDSGLISSF